MAAAEAAPGRSPAPVRDRLKLLSDRFTGGRAVNLRQEAIPAAYRVFFRQIGIDPDTHRTPPEAVALERMRLGGFPSGGLLADALTIATVETGVGLVALDAAAIEGPLGLRLSAPGERLGGPRGRPLSVRQIVVADRVRSLAVLFGDLAQDASPAPSARGVVLAAVRVRGVPDLSLEEALWSAGQVLAEGGGGLVDGTS